MKNCLRKIRKWQRLTLHELAEKSGVAASTIGNFETGRTNASNKMLTKLAVVLRVNVGEILSEDVALPDEKFSSPFLTGRVLMEGVRDVPVISWARAGDAYDYSDLWTQIDESIPVSCNDENAFALIIEGDSMEPDFQAGDRVIISPNSEPCSGDFVVARFAESYGVVFKKFRRSGTDGQTIVLESLNPAYEPIERPRRDFRFIYPAISQVRFLRRK